MGRAMSDGPSVVAQLFRAIGIQRVVYVDDRFGITRERLATRCRDLTVEQLTASGVFPGVELPEDDEPLREERLKAAIDKVSDNQLEPAFDAIAELPNGTDEKDRDAAKGFTDLLGEATDLKLLSLSQWRRNRRTSPKSAGRSRHCSFSTMTSSLKVVPRKKDGGRLINCTQSYNGTSTRTRSNPQSRRRDSGRDALQSDR